MAGPFWINADASGANDGSSKVNGWETPADAEAGLTAAPPAAGEIIYVADATGTLRGQLDLNGVAGDGTSGSPIRLESENANRPKWTTLLLSDTTEITPGSDYTDWTAVGDGEYHTNATFTDTNIMFMVDGERATGQTDYNGNQDSLGTNQWGFPRTGSLQPGEFHLNLVANGGDGYLYWKPASGVPSDFVVEFETLDNSRNHVIMLGQEADAGTGRSWWSITSLDLYGSVRGSCIFAKNAVGITVDDCWLHGAQRNFFTDYGSDITLRNSVIYDGLWRGIGSAGFNPVSATANILFEDNEIHTIGNLESDDGDSEGCMIGPGDSAIVRRNYFHEIGNNFAKGTDSDGVHNENGLASDDADVSFYQNYLKTVYGQGIHLGSKEVTYRNQWAYSNVLWDCGLRNDLTNNPVVIRGFPSLHNAPDAGHANVWFFNNTIRLGSALASVGDIEGAIRIRAKGTSTMDAILNVHIWNNIVDECDCDYEMIIHEGTDCKINLKECHHNVFHPLSGGTSGGIRFILVTAMGSQYDENGSASTINIPAGTTTWAVGSLVGTGAGTFTYDAGYETPGIPNSFEGDPVLIAGSRTALIGKNINSTSESLGYLSGTINYVNAGGSKAATAISDYTGYAFNTATPTIGAMEVTTGTVKSATTGIYLPAFDTIAVWTA